MSYHPVWRDHVPPWFLDPDELPDYDPDAMRDAVMDCLHRLLEQNRRLGYLAQRMEEGSKAKHVAQAYEDVRRALLELDRLEQSEDAPYAFRAASAEELQARGRAYYEWRDGDDRRELRGRLPPRRRRVDGLRRRAGRPRREVGARDALERLHRAGLEVRASMTCDHDMEGRGVDGSPFAGASPAWPRTIAYGFVREEGPAVVLRLSTEDHGPRRRGPLAR